MTLGAPEASATVLRHDGINGGEFLASEGPLLEGRYIFPELFRPAGPDQGGRDTRIAQYPSQGHLSQRLAAGLCQRFQFFRFGHQGMGNPVLRQKWAATTGTRIGGDASPVFPAEQSLGQG